MIHCGIAHCGIAVDRIRRDMGEGSMALILESMGCRHMTVTALSEDRGVWRSNFLSDGHERVEDGR